MQIYALFTGSRGSKKKWHINLSRRVNLIHFIKCFSANHLHPLFSPCQPIFSAILRIRRSAHTANDSIKKFREGISMEMNTTFGGVNWSVQQRQRISEINLNKLFGHKQKACIVNKSM